MEAAAIGGSEEEANGGSEYGEIVVALRKMMKKEIQVMVIQAVQQVIEPIVEGLIRKVVKEEIQSARDMLLAGGTRSSAKEMTMLRERSLQLKFLDEVSDPVLTGKAIKGKEGSPLRVALVDKITGQVVNSGSESSAKVEILMLDASADDNGHDWNLEEFNSRIIREGDKKKPHFSGSNNIYLEEGVGVLHDVKLGHDSSWMKSCKCRLGARVVENFRGIQVLETWTESFTVFDSRKKLYEKHYPPSLSDEVWRLRNIGKDGPRCKHLNKNNIWTVKDFLLSRSIDPQRLQKIVGASTAMWKATVDHAQTCLIDDQSMYLYYHSSSSEFKTGVVFDVVGGLKGAIHDSRYVPVNNLSADEKERAHNLLLTAFENRKDIASFPDETSLLHQFPYKSTDINASDLTTADSLNRHDPTEPGCSTWSYSPCIRRSSVPNSIPSYSSPGTIAMEPLYYESQIDREVLGHDFLSDFFGDNEGFLSPFSPQPSNLSELQRADSQNHQQNNGGSIALVGAAAYAGIMLWRVRARERFMASRGIRAQKRQKI